MHGVTLATCGQVYLATGRAVWLMMLMMVVMRT